ncbi:hypothetical protein, partial [Plesiomonas shigelloides]|uniref:hypothetical protein n=1 Tax=Plesiomonas shigelloides TaxID=703 RepID=UPI001E6201A4
PGRINLNIDGSSSALGCTSGGVIRKEDGVFILLFTADFSVGSNTNAKGCTTSIPARDANETPSIVMTKIQLN